MDDVHLAIGIAVLVTNLVAGVWGGAAWLQHRPSVAFWYLLRTAQFMVVAQVIAGAILLMQGREAGGLHYLYGLLPLLVTLLAEAARTGAAERELTGLDFESLSKERQRLIAIAIVRRETGIMTVSTLIVFFLALRAAAIGGAL